MEQPNLVEAITTRLLDRIEAFLAPRINLDGQPNTAMQLLMDLQAERNDS